METSTGLLVPIEITAYCLGSIDAIQAEKFSRASTWNSKMSANFGVMNDGATNDGAMPESNGVHELRDAPLWSLEVGAHLHWVMPDALTHRTQSDSGVDFSALPNRWLLTRFVLHNNKPVTKSWVIMSDLLSVDKPDNKNAFSLPVDDKTANFRYLGVSEVYTDNWSEPTVLSGDSVPSDDSRQTLFGSPINKVASGDIAFVSYYPNARKLFGFYDALDDVQVAGEHVDLMYTLVGWFSDSRHDPLSTALTLGQLQEQYQWTCNHYSETPPCYSLYHGQVENILWNRAKRYINDNRTPVKADAAIGNNPSETFGAFFNGTHNEQLACFDRLFNAFEIDTLSQLSQPNPSQPNPRQWSELQETLHAGQFTGNSGGTIYTVQSAQVDTNCSSDIDPALPPPLANSLNLLNQYQQELDLAAIQLQQYYWQLFAAWYRIVQVSSTDAGSAYNTLYSLLRLNAQVQTHYANAESSLRAQKTVVEKMLSDSLTLQSQPAPAFLNPNEPTVLLSGEMFDAVRRYGGDARHNKNGYLVCRLNSDTVTQVKVNVSGEQILSAGDYQGVDLSRPNHLIYAQDIDTLLKESCLLNTAFTADRLGADASTLETDLSAWLNANVQSGNVYHAFIGSLPSPVAVQWLHGNPWMPMFLNWQVNFYPLLDTGENGTLKNYRDDFFTANFSVDPNNIGTVTYQPNSSEGGIDIDPAAINFDSLSPGSGVQQIHGTALLSLTATDTLETNIANYLKKQADNNLNKQADNNLKKHATNDLKQHADTTLSTIEPALKSTTILMQSLSGFNENLLMAKQALRLSIRSNASPGTPVANLTNQVTDIIKDLSQLPPLAPMLNGHFNPIRAGFMKFSGEIVDVFGQKRPLEIGNLYIADTMGAVYKQKTEADIVYLQPRLTQPSRLLFRWLAANSSEYDEMNFHPATTPVCGWLLTNHLSGVFFVYDQQGLPLGSLFPSLDNTRIIWQATLGDKETLGQTVDQVMDGQNMYLAQLVKALSSATSEWFVDYWQAVKKAAGLTAPSTSASDIAVSDVGAGTLVGRPLALVQASLLLELQGFSSYNLGWNTLNSDRFEQTDNGLSSVRFPLVLGNIDQIDDGLIGYFKQKPNDDYDYSTFYSDAAVAKSKTGVVPPSATNLLLTPCSTTPGDAPSVSRGEQKVLMLIDPRAGIHVSSGILPTQYLEIPQDQYLDIARSLDIALRPIAARSVTNKHFYPSARDWC
jgi:hypothetical protein